MATLRTHAFTLSDVQTGAVIGHGAICVDARYGSVVVPHEASFDRRHALPHLWKELEGELAVGCPSGALDRVSAVVRFLVPIEQRGVVSVRFLTELPVEVANPSAAAAALDELLRGLAAKPALRLTQTS